MHDSLEQLQVDLERAVARARANGWRIADIRHAFRKSDGPTLDLLEHLGDGIRAWQQHHGFDDDRATGEVKRVVSVLQRLQRIPSVESPASSSAGPDVLGRIRALVAKAESTEFPAEADALYAKAHELMTRHSIDRALLDRRGAPPGIATRRVLLDDPYASQRLVLLVEVADACGCQVLSMRRAGIATVFGTLDDVDATELLYTSLLLQATSAVMHAPGTPRGAPASTVAAFRRSFFTGFAVRVGHRLRALRQAVVAEACMASDDLLPVLADRDAAIDAAVNEWATGTQRRPRISDVAGLAAGQAAGARANLVSQSRLRGVAAALPA